MSGAHDGSVVCATLKTIDSEQRLLAAVWWSIREDFGERST